MGDIKDPADDPAFLRYLNSQTSGKPVRPDPEDYDHSAGANTIAAQANAYRRAQARKILRMYSAWKATQN